MKELLDKLLKSMGIGGRDWAVMLLALLLAFSIWLIHILSLRYNDYLSVPVVAQCNIEGHSNTSSNRCDVVARSRTTGYNVLRVRNRSGRNLRKIVFKQDVMKHKQDDIYYVTSSDLMEYSHLIFGDDVTVEYFTSDTLFFTFPSVDHVKVPVHPVYSISYRQQYTGVGDIRVVPDSVVLYGEPYVLENISRVYTQPLKLSSVDSDIHGILGLEGIRNVRFSTDEVEYSMDVTRYVELKSMVMLNKINVPADKEMLALPSRVEVSLKCAFPLKEDPANSLQLYVDYEDFVRTLTGKCPVRHQYLPEGVISYSVEPFYVECIVRDR